MFTRTHNPKVEGSNPSPAIEGAGENRPFFFAFRVLAFQNRSAQVLVCGVVPAAQALFPQPKGQRLESARTDGERSPCKCPCFFCFENPCRSIPPLRILSSSSF